MKLQVYLLTLLVIALGLNACSSDRTTADQYGLAKQSFTEQNYYDAYRQLLAPAEQGNSDAEYALGYLYYYGKGTPQNQTLGKQWILKAVQDGNKQAAQAYQMILSREQGIMPDDATPAAETYHPAPVTEHHAAPSHTKGHAVAQTSYGSGEKKLFASSPQNYTLQLIGLTSSAYAESFIKQNNLGHRAYYFQRNLNGRDLYVVVYGIYSSKSAATAAIKKLPSKVQQLHPWVRSLAEIQAEIRAN